MSQKAENPSKETYFNSASSTFSPEVNKKLLELELSQAWLVLASLRKDLATVTKSLEGLAIVHKPNLAQIANLKSLNEDQTRLTGLIERKRAKIRELISTKNV